MPSNRRLGGVQDHQELRFAARVHHHLLHPSVIDLTSEVLHAPRHAAGQQADLRRSDAEVNFLGRSELGTCKSDRLR